MRPLTADTPAHAIAPVKIQAFVDIPGSFRTSFGGVVEGLSGCDTARRYELRAETAQTPRKAAHAFRLDTSVLLSSSVDAPDYNPCGESMRLRKPSSTSCQNPATDSLSIFSRTSRVISGQDPRLSGETYTQSESHLTGNVRVTTRNTASLRAKPSFLGSRSRYSHHEFTGTSPRETASAVTADTVCSFRISLPWCLDCSQTRRPDWLSRRLKCHSLNRICIDTKSRILLLSSLGLVYRLPLRP